MSFHEKNAWACLIAIGLAYVPYFVFVFHFPMAALGLFWVSAIALVALLVAFHVVNALATRSIRVTGGVPPVDELDQKIELKAAKWAGFVLSFAVVTWILVAMYSIPAIATSSEILMVAIQWLFAGFVFANAAYYGGIVFRYRRLALA